MPSYYEPDRTGNAAGYHVSDYQRTIFRAAQTLQFSSPVFINDNFQILKLGVINEPMVKDVDWNFSDANIDIDAMALMKVVDPNFTGTLVKSIVIIRPFDENYVVQLLFNQLYPAQISYSLIERDNGILEVTPELVSNTLTQVEHLTDLLANRTSKLTPQSEDIKLIREDLTGSNPENLIIGEKHDVVSVDNHVVIACQYGSIYEHDLVITNTLNNQPLSMANGDYRLIGLDLFKTKRSGSIYAVYDGIEIMLPMVGEVSIDYRAFGNEIDIENLARAAHRLGHIERYLNNNPYITPSSIAGSKIIVSLSNKIATLEEQMRSLIKTGRPTYSDVETNTVLARKIISVDDQPHWWSIAKLYRVEGSTENLLADTFRFRLQSSTTEMQFEASVTVNRDPNFDGKEFEVKVINSCTPRDVVNDVAPKLRILQVMNESYSGLVLQIGMRLKPLYDTLAIENLSGRESCWLFAQTSAIPDHPEDTDVLMPDETSVFYQDGVDTYSNEVELPLDSFITADDLSIPLGINAAGYSAYGGSFVYGGTVDNPVGTPVALITTRTLSGVDRLVMDFILDPGGNNTPISIVIMKVSETDETLVFTGSYGLGNAAENLHITVTIAKADVSDKCVVIARSLDDSISNVFLNIVGITVKY